MKVVSVITEPEVVDRILQYIARTGGRDRSRATGHLRVVRGEVCPETSAGRAHQAEWPGRSGQLTEIEVS